MSAEWYFLFRNEDADLDALRTLDLHITRKNEGRLLQIGLASDLLHLAIAQPVRIRKYRERITLEALRSEDITLYEMETALCLRVLTGSHGKGGTRDACHRQS